MLVFYLLAAGLGGTLLVLSLLLPGSPAAGAEGAPTPAPAPRLPPGELRFWAFPLLSVGTIGATLCLLERTFVTTITNSLLVGIPTGLLAAYLLYRFNGK